MKKFIICALLSAVGSILFTSCTSTTTTVPRETNATSTSRTYSK